MEFDPSRRRAPVALAALVLGVFAAYFVVAALVPDLFGDWPLYGTATLVALAAVGFAVSFAARAVIGRDPGPWRVALAVTALVSLALVAQAASFALGAPVRLTGPTASAALIHLLLWAAIVSSAVVVWAALAVVSDRERPTP